MEQKTENVKKKSRKPLLLIVGSVVIVGLAVVLLVTQVILPGNNYKLAQAMMDSGQYDEAIVIFSSLGNYKDSAAQLAAAKEAKADAEKAAEYARAEALYAAGDYEGAIAVFQSLGSYRDSAQRIAEIEEASALAKAYADAETLLRIGQLDKAIDAFEALGDYQDSAERARELRYKRAESALEKWDLWKALEDFEALGNYRDSAERARELHEMTDNYRWSVIGSICGTNWDTDFPMTAREDGSFASDILWLQAGDEFKIRAFRHWDINYGADGQGGMINVVVPASGNYIVIFYPDSGKIALQRA